MSDDNVAAFVYTVESSYNDIGLCDTSSIASDILWLQLFPIVKNNVTLQDQKNTLLY